MLVETYESIFEERRLAKQEMRKKRTFLLSGMKMEKDSLASDGPKSL